MMTPQERKEIREAARRKLHPRLPFLEEMHMDDEIRRLLRSTPPDGGSPLIAAIKYVRQITNWFLVESKQYVEAVRDGKQIDTRSFRDF